MNLLKMIIYNSDTTILLTIDVNEDSYRYREIQGDNSLTLNFSLPSHTEIPVGSYCNYEGETFTLEKPSSVTCNHLEDFDYSVVFQSAQAKLSKYKFIEVVYAPSTQTFGGTHKLKFNLTAQPQEHLQMVVDNLNLRDSGWSIGTCIKGTEKAISYNHTFCLDALKQIAEQYETEYEIVGKVISLHKVEYNKSTPLALSYGYGNGFKTGIKRDNVSDEVAVEVMYPQGGEQNIDKSKYGSQELLLPISQTIKYDGNKFEDEDGFVAANARQYTTDALGFSVCRADKALSSGNEDSVDCSEIYPKRVGTVSEVIVVDAAKNFYDFIDSSNTINYQSYIISGESMTVIFQSGMLAGKEFDLSYNNSTKHFKITPQDIDGETMPNSIYAPRVGDTYAVFHCALPDEYICDNTHKSGASWEMFRKAVKSLYEKEEQQLTFTGNLDGQWAKTDWDNIGGKIKLGGYVSFTAPFLTSASLVRITAIKDYVSRPHEPEITLSNSVTGGGISSQLGKIAPDEEKTENYYQENCKFTKRRFRDAQATIAALDEALMTNFTTSINPVAVQTMALLVGDESLQFIFVDASDNKKEHNFNYDNSTKILSTEAGIIKHLTLGINTISNAHATSEYKHWNISSFESPALTEATKKYYLYAKCSKTDKSGVFYLSDTAIAFDGNTDYYLLVGILNAEYEGERSFATLYGFTEILPSRITTDKVISSDGKTYIDLVNGIIAGSLKFYDSNSTLKDVNVVTSDLQSQVDGKIETFNQTTNPETQWTTDALKAKHIGDLWYNGKKFRQYKATTSGSTTTYSWSDIDDADISEEITDLVKNKRQIFTTTPSVPYSVGDLWVQGESGDILKCDVAKTSTQAYASSDWSKAGKYTDDSSLTTFINGDFYTEKQKIAEHTAKLKGFTSIDGGLITTNHIKLGNTTDGSETAGISGCIDKTAKDNPAFWAGGNGNGTYAKALEMLSKIVFTHEGRAKIGEFYVDALGNITIKNDDGLGININAGNITALSALKASASSGSVICSTINSYVDDSNKSLSQVFTLATIEVANDGSSFEVGGISCTMQITNATETSLTEGTMLFSLYKDDTQIYIFDDVSISNEGKDGEHKITVTTTIENSPVKVNKGTYTLKAEVNLNTKLNRLEAITSGGALSWSYNPVISRTEIGRNGMLMYYDANNYFYYGYSNEEGDKRLVRETKGIFREDGILASGRVNEVGSEISNAFGSITCTVNNSSSGNGYYTITHNLGHTNYFVLITPVQNSNSRYDGNAVITTKGTNSFSVQTSYSDSQTKINFPFEFLIIGNLTN